MGDGAAVVVGALPTPRGPQSFTVASGTDLAAMQSDLIHCIEFSHLYGAAPLNAR